MTKEQIEYLNSLGVDFNQLSSLGTPEVPQVGDPVKTQEEVLEAATTIPIGQSGTQTPGSGMGSLSGLSPEGLPNLQAMEGLAGQINQMNLTGLNADPVIPQDSYTDEQKQGLIDKVNQMNLTGLNQGEKEFPDVMETLPNEDLVTKTTDMGIEQAGAEAGAGALGGGGGMGWIGGAEVAGDMMEQMATAKPTGSLTDTENLSVEGNLYKDAWKSGHDNWMNTFKSTGSWEAATAAAVIGTAGSVAKRQSDARQVKRNIEQAKFEAGRQDRASIYNDPNSVYYSGPKGYLA